MHPLFQFRSSCSQAERKTTSPVSLRTGGLTFYFLCLLSLDYFNAEKRPSLFVRKDGDEDVRKSGFLSLLYEFLEDRFCFRSASDLPQKQNRTDPAEFWAVFSVGRLLFYEPKKGILEPTLNYYQPDKREF